MTIIVFHLIDLKNVIVAVTVESKPKLLSVFENFNVTIVFRIKACEMINFEKGRNITFF